MCQVPASFVAGCACLYSRNTGEDGLRYIAGDRRSHGYAHDKGCSGRGQVCARGPVDGDAARHGGVRLLAGVCAPGRHGAGHSSPRARPYGDGEHPGRSVPSRRDPGTRYCGGAGHALWRAGSCKHGFSCGERDRGRLAAHARYHQGTHRRARGGRSPHSARRLG